MRILTRIAALAGIALGACVVALALPAPLYLLAGLLAAQIPRAVRRKPKRWVARVRAGSCNYAGKDHFTGLIIECVNPHGKDLEIAIVDPRKDDTEDKVATARAKAEDRAAYLNAVVR